MSELEKILKEIKIEEEEEKIVQNYIYNCYGHYDLLYGYLNR